MIDENNNRVTLTDGIRDRSSHGSKGKSALIIIVIAVILLGVSVGLYLRSQSQLRQIREELAKTKIDPTAQTKHEEKGLIEQVGKLIVLPTDEQPTVATVTDLDKLKDQPFFAQAQLGDKVLIYEKAKKAILFRPTEQKIIELAPLNSGNSLN